VDKLITNRDDLNLKYNDILAQSMSAQDLETLQSTGKLPKGLIFQASSGSSGGKPLYIPRTFKDILNIHQRIMRSYLKCYDLLPRKIAMFGGISHSQAAIKMEIDNTEIRSFTLEEFSKLEEFNPDVISCYPSIARELINQPNLTLNNLKGIKLGGEVVLDVDLKNIQKRFPNIIVLEQYGSTEMPAIAMGCYPDFKKNGLELQTDRFDLITELENDFSPIVVKDNFEDLLFKIPGHYNTGDEGIISNGILLEVRRQGSQEYKYRSLCEELLGSGCINIQVNEAKNEIYYQGSITNHFIDYYGRNFKLIERSLKRIAASNKMGLFS